MLHQIMYERVCRMLVEFKNHVGRKIRDLRIIFLSRFHCKCTWGSRATTVKLLGEMKGLNPHKPGQGLGCLETISRFGNPLGLLLLRGGEAFLPHLSHRDSHLAVGLLGGKGLLCAHLGQGRWGGGRIWRWMSVGWGEYSCAFIPLETALCLLCSFFLWKQKLLRKGKCVNVVRKCENSWV